MIDRMQPAFWGGLFIGVLSSLPIVGNFNICCCLWVISGGVLTAYLLQERSPVTIKVSDGAVAGLVAGAIGAVIAGVLTPMFMFVQGGDPTAAFDEMARGSGEIPPEVTQVFEGLRNVPVGLWYVIPFIFFIIAFPIFGTLGGLLGAAIFKKTPPPPPPGTVEILPPLPGEDAGRQA
jgi:hypothetical protein